jgi:hypothetical protein
LWALLYPSETLQSDPPHMHALAGARLSIQQKHLPGVKAMLPAHAVYALLRDDADHLATVASVEQAAEIQGTTKAAISGSEPQWLDSDAQHEQERKDKERARKRFREEWGYDPPEYA